MLLVLSWTKQTEQVHLLATEWDDKPFVRTKSSSFKGRVVEIIHKVAEYEGRETNQFSLRFEARGQSHYFMMKSWSLALSVINSLASATTKELEMVDFSFYVSKTGYNSVSIKVLSGETIDKPNGDQVAEFVRLDWFISKEKKDSLTRKFIGKGGKEDTDNIEYVKALIALIPEINARCPSRTVTAGGSDLFDEELDFSQWEARTPKTTKSVEEQAEELVEASGIPNGDIPFV